MKTLLLSLLLVTPSIMMGTQYWNIFLSAYSNSIITVSEDTALYDFATDTYMTPPEILKNIEREMPVLLSDCTQAQEGNDICHANIAAVIDVAETDTIVDLNDVYIFKIKDK
jgi:hypothetical protein